MLVDTVRSNPSSSFLLAQESHKPASIVSPTTPNHQWLPRKERRREESSPPRFPLDFDRTVQGTCKRPPHHFPLSKSIFSLARAGAPAHSVACITCSGSKDEEQHTRRSDSFLRSDHAHSTAPPAHHTPSTETPSPPFSSHTPRNHVYGRLPRGGHFAS